jgi:hypothetical protein
MKKTIALLEAGIESACNKTEQFKSFCRVFKSEFTKELQTIGATNIVFSNGHFYISGFFTVDNKIWYFSLPDVREYSIAMRVNPDSHFVKLMYREAKHYKDYSGCGPNRFRKLEPGMAEEMCWSFKLVN